MESGFKWFPYNKGGAFRKWYGNCEYALRYDRYGTELMASFSGHRHDGKDFYFREGVTWTFVSSTSFAARYTPKGFIFDVSGSSLFTKEPMSVASFLCSIVSSAMLKAINPTINFQVGNLCLLPILLDDNHGEHSHIYSIAAEAIGIAKSDWDSHETSWDFSVLPILSKGVLSESLSFTYDAAAESFRCNTSRTQKLEEDNNRIFISAYGLEGELTPEVPLEEITLTCNPVYRYGAGKTEAEYAALQLADTMMELVSYAVGCMMGRYSLDEPGLIYAHSGNEGFDSGRYQRFPADADGVLPLTETEWFPDDAANRFVDFIAVAWPREHLEENLAFVAEALGGKQGEPPRDTIRRYLATGFYKDHLQTYKRRPIYWLFSSGKHRAFQCLVYLHRYHEGTLARMRTEYVIPLQGKLTARMDHLAEEILQAGSTSHRKKLEKERDGLLKQQAELLAFDEKLHHYADKKIRLDLDDGVKVNYAKFGDLLAEVKAVTGGTGE